MRHPLFAATAGVVALLVSACAQAAPGAMRPQTSEALSFTPTDGRPFSPVSAFNLPIPSDAALDRGSSSIVSALTGAKRPAIANIYDYGIPIWDADFTTPRYHIQCTQTWGLCTVAEGAVPIPDTTDITNKDGVAIVIDWLTHRGYELWGAQDVAATRTVAWGATIDLDGMGTSTGTTPSGISRLAGVVRIFELNEQWINHALVLTAGDACASYRYPAVKSNGTSTARDCIPEGARVQLDPRLDVDSIRGITPGEKTIAKALQVYGGYVAGAGPPGIAVAFERPSGEPDPYPKLGFTSDYFALSHIPWSKLRVLASYNGR